MGKRVRPRTGDRVMLTTGTRTARWAGALLLFGTCCTLVWMLTGEHDTGNRLAWSLAVLGAASFIARGVYLGRPVTVGHALTALAAVALGIAAHVVSFALLGYLLIVAAGMVLMRPTSARPDPAALPRIWGLVQRTHNDPLAPFAMQRLKSYHTNADGTAVIAFRTKLGFAVVSGDPIGDWRRFPELVADFAAMCDTRGWRIAVLGCSQRRLSLWRGPSMPHGVRPIPIGRDVVVNVAGFHLSGRKFRNVRQAVQRTRNAGMSTAVVPEADLDDALRAELAAVVRDSASGAHTERGFSMMLDHTLLGEYPGVELIVARDRGGRIQGFHRYAIAGAGSDVSLDSSWRRRDAPNGIDERLSVDMIHWAKDHDARRLSLAFAPFPEIFQETGRGALRTVVHLLIHLGDPLIKLESLYRYLRKFHALRERRYVLLSLRQLPMALCALLLLEFSPRRLPPIAGAARTSRFPSGRRSAPTRAQSGNAAKLG
ncbi:hypothetical protein Mycch_2924 [Mycolicibacterium chubuense NBB4]|uniref:Phosphatidylglycerol lysyltransferase C-terminal domain-containing protein n=1 Tax=Mycolicibacterium chubuense (strain NBB4) TaxID=710421 RepID=I4BK77_MYCCN|nr:phosphatidylglycerol lysyltransferase domain-containing protein [Mycolicibacterium chubuense]AFM17684.1 hypothetical protein Mycch_2924 [Mycolicibacterium chubuense NBB4]